MSADNWTYCPVCARDRDLALTRRQELHAATYGKVSADEFLQRSRAVADDIARTIRNFEATFREDYEIGIDGSVFSISYHGKCTTCGFTHVAKSSATLELPPAVAAVDPHAAK